MSNWDGATSEIDRDTFDYMVQDYIVDHGFNDEENDPITLDGEPYISEWSGRWVQLAHDSISDYHIILTENGDIDIR